MGLMGAGTDLILKGPRRVSTGFTVIFMRERLFLGRFPCPKTLKNDS